MDRTRLQPSFVEMSAAETAYDAALRRHADATRAAQGRSDAASRAALARAGVELEQARSRVAAARVALDITRATELAAFDTGDQFLGVIPGTEVLGLFPVGLEARLEPGRLRIRVWPDAISTSTHDPRLAESELAAAKRYWRAEVAATAAEDSRAAWRALADEIGTTRAAWAARVLTPVNLDALAPGAEPVFPTVPMLDEAAPFVPRAGVLPDRWIAVGTRDNVRVFDRVGPPIPIDLAVGLDTTPAEIAGLANREGEPIQLPPRMRWMTDFALAVEVGMAFDIALADVDRLDELFVFGVRVTQTAAGNADALESLITGHRFSRGFAFVPQDTPTNNSSAGGSGLPSRSARIETAFEVERRPRAFAAGLAANGVTAARALGVAPDVFASVPGSGAVGDVIAEPDGFEPEAARAMRTALFQVMPGAAFEDFLLLPTGRIETLREYFRQHVHAAGPVPAVRVGRQPYGVLPVTSIDGFVAQPGENIDARLIPLLRAARTWFGMLRHGPVFTESSESALRHLGRSTKLYTETTQQNPSHTGSNRWASLAGSLARASRNSIRDTWRNSRITGTVDGEPQPVTMPITDGATAAEFAALAATPPAALLTRPAATSLLGRIARHAALLEWSRFARAACEAAIDIPSRRALSLQASRAGSDVYIDVLVQAFSPATPQPPVNLPIDTRMTRARQAAPRPLAPTTDPTVAPLRPRDDEPRDPRDPPDPPDPPEPRDPPEPPGEPEVTAAERQAIRALVGSLAQPLATCPGAARLASFRAALAQLASFPADRLESEMFGALDVCNHRLDAWFTSLASQRLATLRAAAPRGLIIGGWGCLQDVRRADPLDPLQRAEFIHTPSLDQAAAAAVLRAGARRAQGSGSHHADVDLSSRRVRLARWILEGIRNGRSLGDLLGSRFERAVKGTPAEAQLGELRARFPALGSKGVLDGLLLQTQQPASADPDVQRGADALDDAVDAVSDVLTAEAVYQIVRGNPAGALVNIEALAAGAPPPEVTVTETPSSGIRLTHRVVVALPAQAVAPGWPAGASVRAAMEPLLDAWCGLLLGPAAGTVLTVDASAGATATVPLAELGIAAIDVVLSGRSKGAELEERVVLAAVRRESSLTDAHVRHDAIWKRLVGLCTAAARVLTHGESLRVESFDAPTAMAATAKEDFGDLPDRVAAAAATLAGVRDALVARTGSETTVQQAASFGIRVPGLLLGGQPSNEQQDALLAAVLARLGGAADGTPRERLRALFGGDLPGVVTFTPRAPDTLVTAVSPPPSLFDGKPAAPAAWLDAVGRTHPNAAALAEVLLRKEAGAAAMPSPLRVAQLPWTDGDRWIATAFSSSARRPPAGRLSVVIHAPAGFAPGQPIGGLLVDAWTETIPAATRDTAMALRFNNASARAPQAILLAVNPDPAQPWTTTTLIDVLQETLALTRLRMQPATTFSQGGLMPFAWLGRRPGQTGISFPL